MLGVLSKVVQMFSKAVREWCNLKCSAFFQRVFQMFSKEEKRMVQSEMLGVRGSLIYCSEFGDAKKGRKWPAKNRGLTHSFVLKVLIPM
jgi:hypothetical protein